MKQHILILIGIIFLSFLAYNNSFNNQFILDDNSLFLNNNQNISLEHWPNAFHFDNNIEERSQPFYRPFAIIIPMTSYSLFSDNVWGHHMANWILFVLACFTTYLLILKLTKQTITSSISAFLFAIHPINALLINYKSASIFSFQLIMLSLATLNFITFATNKRIGSAVIFSILFVISLLSHETSFIIPITCWLISFSFLRKSFKESIVSITLPAFIAIVYLIIRIFLIKTIPLNLNTHIYDLSSAINYFSAFSQSVIWYLSNLITLKPILLKWSTPIAENMAIFPTITIFILVFITIVSVMKRYVESIIPFCIAWFTIGLIPVFLATFFYADQTITIEPHWLYFSSIFLFCIMASIISYCYKRNSKASYILIGFVFSILILSTIQNNPVFANNKTLSQYWLHEIPDSKEAQFYYATELMNEGKYTKAVEFFNKALNQSFSDWQIHHNLAQIAYLSNDLDTAQLKNKQALSINPNSSITHNNLGIIFKDKGQTQEAMNRFAQAIRINPYQTVARHNLANMFIDQGNEQKAEELYLEGLSLDMNILTYSQLINLYIKINENDKILSLVRRIISKERNPTNLTQLASYLAEKNLSSLSILLYGKALDIDKNHSETFLELGKLYANSNQYDQAINIWMTGQSKNPQDKRFQPLIDQATTLASEKK